MRRVLQVLVIAIIGYAIYELIRRWTAQQEAVMGARAAVEPLGHVRGAAITGGGEGAPQRTLGPDGSTVTERVGRGVVRRNTARQQDQATQGA